MAKAKTTTREPKVTATPPPVVPPTPPKPKTASGASSMHMTVLVVLIVVGLSAGYYAYRLVWKKTAPATTNTVVTQNENTNTIDTPNVNYFVTDTNIAGTTLGEVSWQTPKSTTSLHLLRAEAMPANSTDAHAEYFTIGKVNSGSFSGGTVYLMVVTYDSPQGPDWYYVIQKDGALTMVAKNSSVIAADAASDTLSRDAFSVDTTYELPGIRFPQTLTGPKSRQTLRLDPSVHSFFSLTNLTKVFVDPVVGQVYTGSTATTPTEKPDTTLRQSNVYTSGGFYVRAPDGSLRVYYLVPDIIPVQPSEYSFFSMQADVPSITWTDGTKNTVKFSLTSLGGCGSMDYLHIVGSDMVKDADLTKVGSTDQGDAVYELTDRQSSILKKYYDTTYYVYEGSGTPKATYETFVASHPIVFWKDPFGRLVMMENMTFAPQAECGKPVIYLYPQATTNVDVTLAPQGGFTKSEPAYNTGWHVTATPKSQLTDRTTGKTYPYLFWEGRGGIYTSPTQGFVVKQADVHTFLETKLAQLGLNEKETADFIEFWEPRMQGSPYYQVAFMGNRTMDELAPLLVTPKPDTIIRVLMDFKPLAKPVTLIPQIIRTPQRTGFTVVEWGGVLR